MLQISIKPAPNLMNKYVTAYHEDPTSQLVASRLCLVWAI